MLNLHNESSGSTNNSVDNNIDAIQEDNVMNLIKNESGTVAIIIALLTMGLLTALGTVAYMNSATEVKISANFQNSQRAFYAADGGIEMGMDSLEGSFSALTGWSALLETNIFTDTALPGAPNSFYTVRVTDDEPASGYPWVADEDVGALITVDANRRVIITSTGTYRNPAKATVSVDAYLQFNQGYDSYGGKDLTGHNSNSLRGDIDWGV